MPQSPERKREYNRERQRKLRGYGILRSHRLRGERESEREGVVPGRNVVPDLEKGNVVPKGSGWFPLIDFRRKYQVRFMEYILALNDAGMRLVKQDGLFYLVPQPLEALKQSLAASEVRMADIEARHAKLVVKVEGAYARNTQLEADQARLEMMMDSMLREGDLS